MSYINFIKDFKASSEKFYSLKNFFELSFYQKIPEKISFQNSVESFLSDRSKDAIMTNFFLNKSFSTIEYWPSGIIKFIIETFEEDNSSSDHLARLCLLLHLSKSNLNQQGFIHFLKNLRTIEVISNVERILSAVSPSEILKQVKKSNPIFESISDIVFKITDKKVQADDFDDVCLTFFKSKFNDLNGFAGINQIYLSIDRIDELISILDQSDA